MCCHILRPVTSYRTFLKYMERHGQKYTNNNSTRHHPDKQPTSTKDNLFGHLKLYLRSAICLQTSNTASRSKRTRATTDPASLCVVTQSRALSQPSPTRYNWERVRATVVGAKIKLPTLCFKLTFARFGLPSPIQVAQSWLTLVKSSRNQTHQVASPRKHWSTSAKHRYELTLSLVVPTHEPSCCREYERRRTLRRCLEYLCRADRARLDSHIR